MRKGVRPCLRQKERKSFCYGRTQARWSSSKTTIGKTRVRASQSSSTANALLSNVKSIVAESDNRHNKMLFKLAVEMAVMMNVVAASNEIDEISLARLRGECIQEVKRLNGNFSFEDAVEWQS